MDKQSGVNTAEKQRLREAIAEQVRNFLDSGGNIDVVGNTPAKETQYRGSIWDTGTSAPVLQC
ncbi:hypothetical protein R0137_10215 [Congregibacter brevis]|uniref:Transcriptional regulator SutA RNAP-binding domain-containing protein n=1 Tax=Congregibacter brevis TaxID=3081201 RepID=A0ABZ0I9B0_9GAMM|nr:hypothetical protein R0137_10215 [Congregibacter sp. IMCC45268]